jgi:hypothetical protein
MATHKKGTTDEAAEGAPGMKAVEEALKLEDFPMMKGDIYYSVGDMEVEDGFGGAVPVRDLVDQLRREEFGSADEIMHALVAVRDSHVKKSA